jgi:hypothetical protein
MAIYCLGVLRTLCRHQSIADDCYSYKSTHDFPCILMTMNYSWITSLPCPSITTWSNNPYGYPSLQTLITNTNHSIAIDGFIAVHCEAWKIGPMEGWLMLLQSPDLMGNGKSRRGEEGGFQVRDTHMSWLFPLVCFVVGCDRDDRGSSIWSSLLPLASNNQYTFFMHGWMCNVYKSAPPPGIIAVCLQSLWGWSNAAELVMLIRRDQVNYKILLWCVHPNTWETSFSLIIRGVISCSKYGLAYHKPPTQPSITMPR